MKLIQGDVTTHKLAQPFHLCITDVPYNLSTITRFGKQGSAPAKVKPGDDGYYARSSSGFMNAKWDTEVAFDPDTWQAIASNGLPGAMIAAACGSRTWHRMATAMEHAGLIIHPTICVWLNGQGKGAPQNTSLNLDRQAGVTRKAVEVRKQKGAKYRGQQEKIDNGGFNDPNRTEYVVTAPETELAKDWSQHRYGSQVLAARCEYIIVAMVPPVGKSLLDSMVQHGTGGYNTEASRNYSSRYPSNFAICHSPGCEFVEYERAGLTCSPKNGNEPAEMTRSVYGKNFRRKPFAPFGSDNGFEWIENWNCHHSCAVTQLNKQASRKHVTRYYMNLDWSFEKWETLHYTNPVRYESKVSNYEREVGLIGKLPCTGCGGIDTAYHQTSTGVTQTCRRNDHPTLKPIRLWLWLAQMFLPPERYKTRRCYVPFAGTGSEMIGARFAGFDDVVGVELEESHVRIGEPRLEFWERMKGKGYDVETVLGRGHETNEDRVSAGQLELF